MHNDSTAPEIALAWSDEERRGQLFELLTSLGYRSRFLADDLSDAAAAQLVLASFEVLEPHLDDELLCRLPCVVLGPDDSASTSRCFRAGALDYLAVDAERAALATTIERALVAAQHRDQRCHGAVMSKIVDGAGQANVVLSPDGAVSYVNAKARELFELSPAAAPESLDVGPRLTSDGAGELLKSAVETVRQQGSWSADVEVLSLDGKRRPVRASLRDYGEPGQGPLLALSLRDLSSERSAEEELARQADALRRAQEVAHVGVWVWNIATSGLEWSDEIFRIFGRRPREFEPSYERFLETVHPEDRDIVTEGVGAAVSGEREYSVEHRIVLPDGQVRWVHERGDVARDQNGEPLEMLGTVYDITELRAAREERMGYARLFEDAANEIYIVAAQDLSFVHINRPALENLGYTPALLETMVMSDLTPELSAPAFDRLVEPVRSGTEDRVSLRTAFRRRDGTTYPVEAFLHRSVFDGRPVLVALCYDRTGIEEAEERRRLLAELERRNTEMERFTYTVSHDLKSPLITVRGFLSLLQQDLDAGDSAAVAEDMEHIELGAATMANLLDELLALSRVGRIVNPPERVDLADVFREASQRISGVLESRGVELEIAPDLPTVDIDRPRMVEVAQNLLENAVRYSGDKPHPRVEVTRVPTEPGFVRLRVRDDGIGIEPRFHRKVFELFERLDSSVEGTGIGLSFVQRIVEVHQGRVWVESEGLGHGSSFFIELPDSGTGGG